MKLVSFIFSLMLLGLAACAGNGSSGLPAHTANEPVRQVVGREREEGRIIGRLAPGGLFFVLEIGMTRSEVEQLIGAPKTIDARSSGISWVPYYFGSDSWSTESYYKGEGRLVFNADSRLILIDASAQARR